jgi:hypothetical protein
MRFPGIFEPDPVLYVRLKPNTISEEGIVLGRRLVMEVDYSGCRPVIGQPLIGNKTLAVYGCSCTFGHAVAREETFCSLLQAMLPSCRVENHGVSGYGTTQSLLQLERVSRWAAADYVTFCWIPHHQLRNVADLSYLQRLIEWTTRSTPERTRSFPRAYLDCEGSLQFRSIGLPRWELLGINLEEFQPDLYYLDLICFSLFKRAAEIVRESGGHFFVTTLKGHFSEKLQQRLNEAKIPFVDAALEGPEYTSLPDDRHPNALAHRLYGNKIRDYLLRQSKELAS